MLTHFLTQRDIKTDVVTFTTTAQETVSSARMRSEGVVGSVCVCTCVCLSVTLHLTSRMSVRLKNDTIYLTGTEGQKIRAVFSKTASFERYGVICVSRQRARPYLVFVTTQASLLVKKANEILSTTRNTSQ